VIVAPRRARGAGPLEGLRAGLKALPESVDAAYVTSCDVPLLVPAFVAHMLALLGDHDIAVMEIDGFTHPLSAVYRRSVLPQVESLLAQDRLRPVFLFDAVRTRRVSPDEMRAVDPDLRTLRNLNTREDYRSAGGALDVFSTGPRYYWGRRCGGRSRGGRVSRRSTSPVFVLCLISPGLLTAASPVRPQRQDAKAVVTEAIRAMGMSALSSISVQGTAAVGNFGQSRGITFGLASSRRSATTSAPSTSRSRPCTPPDSSTRWCHAGPRRRRTRFRSRTTRRCRPPRQPGPANSRSGPRRGAS
jgi:molybdopterin-guanine dinucleotide biosynthesis protein A